MRQLILKSFQSPGDILMLTAAVRDLHQAHGGQFQTDVRTSADAIWDNNPYITSLQEGANGVELLDMHYPLIQQSNQRPYHFIHGYVQYLEERLNLRVPVTHFHGDIHLTKEEKESPPPGAEIGVPDHFWIIIAGGKYDFTAKWWNPASYQKVVDHFRGKLTFVQCGEKGHWHNPLSGVINLVGKTSLREFVRLMYHADGVVCPVTFPMHLAAAVETKPKRPRHRPCVVISGGREPPHWEAYPHHQFISMVGALPCCSEGGCWKSRCQTVGDGDQKDRHDLCEKPIQISPELRIAKCMDMISPEEVIRRIELYYAGGVLAVESNQFSKQDAPVHTGNNGAAAKESRPKSPSGEGDGMRGVPTTKVLIQFTHGLGDAIQFTTVLRHLRHYHRDWEIDVASNVGKHSAFHGFCRQSMILDRDTIAESSYDRVVNLAWDECWNCNVEVPSTKAERCLQEVFGLKPLANLCMYTINQGDEAKGRARKYLAAICQGQSLPDGKFPAVCIHYEGNTATENKNLPVEMVRKLCELIKECGFVPVILDWDYRTPLADGKTVFNPDHKADLWGGTGTGDAEILAALIDMSSLMIGVDSGPLHVAGAVSTPTLAVWTGHHPVHYFALTANVTHLVPENHGQMLRGDRAAGEAVFKNYYKSQSYQDLWECLSSMVKESLLSQRFSNARNGAAKQNEQPTTLAKASQPGKNGVRALSKEDLPRLLVSCARHNSQEGSSVALLDKGEIVLTQDHPRGELRGFARLAGKLWAVDAGGTLYHVNLESSCIRLAKVAVSDLASDAHDLSVVNGQLATASSQGIVLYDPKTHQWSVRRPWVPAGIFDGNQPHCNSVIHDGENYVLSLLSRKLPGEIQKPHEGVVIRWGQAGFAEHPLASGQVLPNSLALYQSQVWWCDSGHGAVCREDGWRTPDFDGFTRGLCVHRNKGIVGLCKNPELLHQESASCAICLFDLEEPGSYLVTQLNSEFAKVNDIICVP